MFVNANKEKLELLNVNSNTTKYPTKSEEPKVITNESDNLLDKKEISPTKCLVPSANTAMPEQPKEMSSQPNSVSDLPRTISDSPNLGPSVIKPQGSETPV